MNDTSPPAKLLRILVVEDDDVDFMLIQKLLAASMRGEFTLERANTFESGFEQIALKCHDLYLFDYWLESGTGLDLLHEVNAHGSVAPVILLTRDDDHQIDLKAMQVGAADLLVKGKTMPLLLEHAIRYALERHRLIVELRALSLRDGLTGLYNRRGFTMLGDLQLRLVRRFKREIGVFFADVDGLKGINDRYGHAEGDLVIAGAAEVLTNTFRATDIVARLGGDEFTILTVDDSAIDTAGIKDRLQQNVDSYNTKKMLRHRLSMSIGFARCDPDKNSTIDELMAIADRDLYAQKSLRKKRNADPQE